MILADTSAWVEFDRGTGSAVDRRLLDRLIASVAWRSGATLLAHDADMDRVARVMGIELDDASLRA